MTSTLPKLWLVWSHEHNAFWRADRCGYTQFIEQAGRYSREEAEGICRAACPRANSTLAQTDLGTVPPEICFPSPEAADLLDLLTEALEGIKRRATLHPSDTAEDYRRNLFHVEARASAALAKVRQS